VQLYLLLVKRHYWINRIEEAWEKRTVVWLAGVRRVGKTYLCQNPTVRIIATGSSTLSASSKFKDTLAGRKRDLWLTPMCLRDLSDAKQLNLEHRFLRGGLPPFFLAKDLEERDFQEWIDAYWAKDIQELFRLERRDSFQKFTELILAQSGASLKQRGSLVRVK
jgi:hypothetical protein